MKRRARGMGKDGRTFDVDVDGDAGGRITLHERLEVVGSASDKLEWSLG